MKAPGGKKVRAALKVHNHSNERPFEINVGAYFSRHSAGHVWIGLKRGDVELMLHFKSPAELRALLADLGGRLADEVAKAQADRDHRERPCARPGCGHIWDEHSMVGAVGRACYGGDIGETCRCEGFIEPLPPSPPPPEPAGDPEPAAGPPPTGRVGGSR